MIGKGRRSVARAPDWACGSGCSSSRTSWAWRIGSMVWSRSTSQVPSASVISQASGLRRRTAVSRVTSSATSPAPSFSLREAKPAPALSSSSSRSGATSGTVRMAGTGRGGGIPSNSQARAPLRLASRSHRAESRALRSGPGGRRPDSSAGLIIRSRPSRASASWSRRTAGPYASMDGGSVASPCPALPALCSVTRSAAHPSAAGTGRRGGQQGGQDGAPDPHRCPRQGSDERGVEHEDS